MRIYREEVCYCCKKVDSDWRVQKKREEIKIRYAKEWRVLHKQICELSEKKRSIKSKEKEELEALLHSHWKDLECLKEEKRELLREYRKWTTQKNN